MQAELRFSAPHIGPAFSIADANLRLAGVGALYWEENLAGRLDIEDQVVIGGDGLVPTEADGSPLPAIPNRWHPSAKTVVKALDERTLVALARPRLGGSWPNYDEPLRLHIFDTWNKRQAALIDAPAEATHRNRFGGPQSSFEFIYGIAVAVWHDTPETAWLFVGSSQDTSPETVVDGGSATNVGGMYIYRLDWRQDPLKVELVNTLRPPLSEAGNRWGTNHTAYYGTSLTISEDGSTLAVAAHQVDAIGAIYVYTRPSGGLDWGDLDYADGVKVTTTQTATWGAGAMTAPFDGGALSTCDAYCSTFWAAQRTNLGQYTVGLSADGRVLAAGAEKKEFASSTPGGSFVDANKRTNRGEVYVWLAPAGGWEAAPRVSESGKELIEAKSDASSFDPELHYSPGPDRRVEQPDAVLLALPWDNTSATEKYFGRSIAVSPDGSTVAVSLGAPGHIHIFQRDSAADWDGAGELLRSAALTDLSSPTTITWLRPGEQGGLAFSRDGRTLAVGDVGYRPSGAAYLGRILLFSPSGGAWRDATVSDARILMEPGGARENGAYAFPIYGLSGQRMATSALERAALPLGHGRAYLSDGGCTTRMADEVSTWTCPIEIAASTNAVIPPGTPDGVFTLSGQATLNADSGETSSTTLTDRAEVAIGDVKQVAELKFDFATDSRGTVDTFDDRPYPDLLEQGQETTMQLQILSESGMPAEGGSLASVLFWATGGTLSTPIGDGCQGRDGGRSCEIDVSELDSSNSGRILVTLRHSGQAGTANVSASVYSALAENLSSETLAITLAGPATAISIAAPTAGVLNVNAESAPGAEAGGVDTDQRDMLTLAVTATDAGSNKVAVPGGVRRASVLGPDGQEISGGITIEWPLGGRRNPTLSSAGDLQARVNINRAPSEPLASGEYTLELRAGELSARQTFLVSGDPATVDLSEPDGSLVENGRFTITATVTDGADAAVPDGTRVRWETSQSSMSAVLVQLRADSATKAGKASATYLNVTPGGTYVRATAGEVSNLKLLTISSDEPPPSVADSLSLPPNSAFNVWLGAEPIAASALVEALDQVNSVWAQFDGAWFSYIVADGRVVPGSSDFTIQQGAIIWLNP